MGWPHSAVFIGSQEKETIMTYVDGFVVPVPQEPARALPPHGAAAGKVWREHGALQYRECVADDVKPGKSRRSRRP